MAISHKKEVNLGLSWCCVSQCQQNTPVIYVKLNIARDGFIGKRSLSDQIQKKKNMEKSEIQCKSWLAPQGGII